jgi:hypothetical protein
MSNFSNRDQTYFKLGVGIGSGRFGFGPKPLNRTNRWFGNSGPIEPYFKIGLIGLRVHGLDRFRFGLIGLVQVLG